MSAFLVENDTINRIVYWLSREITKSSRLKEQLEQTTGIDTSKENWE